MKKLWGGGNIDPAAESFNRSIGFDKRLWRQDIDGSIAHVTMLGRRGIIAGDEADGIITTLKAIKDELGSGALAFDDTAEDVHTFIENELTKRLPVAGKKLHTGRSRNDQVALDMRMWCSDAVDELSELLSELVLVIDGLRRDYAGAVMCGYTHMQRAQPVTFGYHMGAYSAMFKRDAERLADAKRRICLNPLGSGALAGTTYALDRALTTKLLGFSAPIENTMDAVSDRDYAVELLAALAIVMTHISRLSEELILWSSAEFRYIEFSSDYSTGSSIMPQKKNPDIAELARGKTGRVYGDLMALLTVMKGLPLAYNKDMQEDKEAVFDAVDTVAACLGVFAPMLKSMRVNTDKMREHASEGFMAATDIADYLVVKGMPFRDAYNVVKALVAECVKDGKTFEALTEDDFRRHSKLMDADILEVIKLENCVSRRGMK